VVNSPDLSCGPGGVNPLHKRNDWLKKKAGGNTRHLTGKRPQTLIKKEGKALRKVPTPPVKGFDQVMRET